MAWMHKHIPTICFFLVMCYLTIKIVPILGEKTPHSQSQVEPKSICQSSGPIIGSRRVSNPCSPNANWTKTPSSGELVNENEVRVHSINKKQNRHVRYTLSDNEYDPNADFGLFTVKISLGLPQQYYSLIVDTGSRWTWVRCRFCRVGCDSDDPLYDPTKSLCKVRLSNHFFVNYGDKSYINGIWGCDTLNVGDDLSSIMNFQFGCALNIVDGSGDNFANASGYLGLGKGDSSLVSQGGASMQVFSYFVPGNGGGADLQFGDKAREKSYTCTNQFTPMVRGSDQEKYYIDLVGISVDGNELNVPSTELMSRGTIIDSGTTITRLPEVVYSAFRDAVRESMSSYTLLDDIDELMDTCYSLEGLIEFPEIKFHFGEVNTIDVILTKEGTIWRKTDTLNCLAFAAAEGYSIIGMVQQRGFNVLYDLEGETIGFGTNSAKFIHHQNEVRAPIIEKIAEKKSDKYFVLERLKRLLPDEYIIWPQRKRYGYKTQYIWDTKITSDEEVEKELDEPLSIKTLHYKTQHGSKTLADEKRIFREMRRAKEIVCPKDTKMNQNQVTFAEIQNMRSEKRIFNLNVKNLKRKLESIKNDIKSLQNSLDAINRKKGKIYAAILQLKRQNYTS